MPSPEPKDEEVKKAWNFCRKSSKSIEICYKNMKGEKILTRVHFQFDPVVKGVKKGKWLLSILCTTFLYTE